jgi:2,4-dienoyl-CoA reductase-like NADH-dependent reductase (Old Yellow Enzyme family)
VHDFLGTKDGQMTEAEYAMYETLAKNGIGTIITGHMCVAPGGRANPEQINIFDDRIVSQLAEAAKRVHVQDSLFIVQLNHAGPRAIDSDDLADVVARPLKKGRQARELLPQEIEKIEKAFVAAARRAMDAGADGVQIHAAHSYLLSRFIDPLFNQRTDEYGGSVRNRFRMTEEIIKGIQAYCGDGFPIFIKINNDTKGDDAAYKDDILWIVRRCHELGVELVELSGADFINLPHDATLYYLDRIAWLKKEVPKQRMSLVGGVRSLDDMEKVLASGLDMVSLGRALIAEPDFLQRSLANRQARSICVSCSRCFVLPQMHPGVRCVWEWKKIRAAAKKQ